MIIDCETCIAPATACQDCVVTALLGPPDQLELSEEDQRVIAVLADGGLVPPLRVVASPVVPQPATESGKIAG